MKKSKWWHFKRWIIRVKNKPKEHKLWLQEYESFLATATPEQLSQFLSDMKTMEEIEAREREINGDTILDKIINILNVFLLIAGVAMICYGSVIVYLCGINTEAAVYIVVGAVSLTSSLFDYHCKRQLHS